MGKTIQDTKLSVGEFIREFSIPPTVPDDTPRTIIVEYDAMVHFYMRQDGSASTWKHPIDTRRCKFWTKSWISRQIYLEMPDGSLEELGPEEIIGSPPAPKPSMPSFSDLVNFLYKDKTLYGIGEILSFGGLHRPCGKYRAKFVDSQPKIIAKIKEYLAEYDGISPLSFDPDENIVSAIRRFEPGTFSDEQLGAMEAEDKPVSFVFDN